MKITSTLQNRSEEILGEDWLMTTIYVFAFRHGLLPIFDNCHVKGSNGDGFQFLVEHWHIRSEDPAQILYWGRFAAVAWSLPATVEEHTMATNTSAGDSPSNLSCFEAVIL